MAQQLQREGIGLDHSQIAVLRIQLANSTPGPPTELALLRHGVETQLESEGPTIGWIQDGSSVRTGQVDIKARCAPEIRGPGARVAGLVGLSA